MKKILFSILTLLVLVIVKPAMAQEATTSGSPSPAETTQELKERIQRIVEEKSDQIKGVIDQISQQKRGFIGQVERVTEESLTITNTKGTEIIPFDENVSLLKSNQEISIDDVAVGDWLVVMGLIIDDAFTPKRILVSSVSIRPKNHLVAMGTIIDQSSKEITILSRQNEELVFKTGTKTKYQDRSGETAFKNDFTEDIQVLIIGDEDDESKNASIIRSLVSLEALQDNE
ncbi:MAG: hypothetical protein HN846_02995 [Candidatus Pacebacteria bacterium]|jgi:hypothetical protein|nr:hypothetical protein [Candidatus Paceibacterota bacterium]MBT3511973.1 hypothetical protein [Candidatus Paceibacterota bacterium]MBT4005295.1 hypothetical protein [Candidatus Paceibacterota bacterium]MBT4358514.1 hypothetical protein [Candidatus Paceibacterota bacterium]MBT4681162.1 hypothetical protein [Candidatus Paceibacterota bacterium]